ncbi:RNA polymerase sigma factor [Terrabacter sp. MAHUQ-38]|uniref:RNA polymerase sigma factor n=1 Tax=unclassified Terrabacter TaxID=2630222 RepID=UPI00165D853B|nr:sigma-70 family RNA polymerase sigma factor [Terrabacter sp. MAHUQ-38]MBC9820362.1 sigma-70 family RNA polymerase sigma factor [Terrabacter sp. MAHUQ-38]
MTAESWDDRRSGTAVSVGDQDARNRPEPTNWVAALATDGPEQAAALRELHALMIRAAGHQVWRMRASLPDPSPAAVDVIVNQAADEAMTALLGKLHTFEGRSRFTTWAFKFAILQAATEVRRLQWQHREVELRDLDVPSAPAHDSPELCAEGTDLAGAVADAMRRVLTPYQRRIAIALLVDGVPIDVLAARLGTNRGALYKTLHDVRVRLRAELIASGYLSPPRAGPRDAVSSDHRSRVSPNPTAGTS